MNIKMISIDECELFKLIDRSDKIRYAWSINADGIRTLDFNYLDITDYGSHVENCIGILRNIIIKSGTVYGAFDDNRIIGMASVLPNQGNSKKFSILVSIDVSFNYRRKGIGKVLLDICVKHSQELECETLLVAANPFESTIKFLKSNGFLYTKNPQNKMLIQENMLFPLFDFPPPFGGNIEQPIYLELPLNEYQNKDYFYNHTTLDEINLLNCFGATRLTVTDRQSFYFGFNPVYTMATYRYEPWGGEAYKILLACFDTFPVGFLGYGVDDNKSVYIEPMMVDSSFQKKRISSRMFKLFEQRIRNLKYKEIIIGHRTDNIDAATAYEKAGYVLTKIDGLSSSRHKIL